MFDFTCPCTNCDSNLSVPFSLCGSMQTCQDCGQSYTVPVEPKAKYPPDDLFSQRMCENRLAKIVVGKKIVDTCLIDGRSAFISEGSSTFYIGLLMFSRGSKDDHIWTNNLALAHEYPLWGGDGSLQDFRLTLIGGDIRSTHQRIGQEAAYEGIKAAASEAEYTILATRAIFPNLGPTDIDHASAAISLLALKSALEAGKKVVLVADHEKFQVAYDPRRNYHQAYDAVTWNKFLTSDTTYIVTNLPPGCTADEMYNLGQQLAVPNGPRPRNITDWYAKNTYPLKLEQSLGTRFIECLLPPC